MQQESFPKFPYCIGCNPQIMKLIKNVLCSWWIWRMQWIQKDGMTCLSCFGSMCPEMSKHYNQKATLEQELPTVTQKLRTTTECLLGSLGSLTNSTGKVRPIGGRQQPSFLIMSVQTEHATFIDYKSIKRPKCKWQWVQLDHVSNLLLILQHRIQGSGG